MSPELVPPMKKEHTGAQRTCSDSGTVKWLTSHPAHVEGTIEKLTGGIELMTIRYECCEHVLQARGVARKAL